MTYIMVFIIYKFFLLKDFHLRKRRKKNVIPKKQPVEIKLLASYFKVDINKLEYHKVLNSIAIISSFDISIIITIACLSKVGLIQIVVSLILLVPTIYFSYYFLAKYYINKIEKGSYNKTNDSLTAKKQNQTKNKATSKLTHSNKNKQNSSSQVEINYDSSNQTSKKNTKKDKGIKKNNKLNHRNYSK